MEATPSKRKGLTELVARAPCSDEWLDDRSHNDAWKAW